jgi:hypothetical protein
LFSVREPLALSPPTKTCQTRHPLDKRLIPKGQDLSGSLRNPTSNPRFFTNPCATSQAAECWPRCPIVSTPSAMTSARTFAGSNTSEGRGTFRVDAPNRADVLCRLDKYDLFGHSNSLLCSDAGMCPVWCDPLA